MRLQALSGHQLLEIWDKSQSASSQSQTLRILAMATGAEPASLPQLTLGEREGLLLRLRRLIFGPTLRVRCLCPNCGATTNVLVEVADIEAAGADAERQGARPFATGPWQGWFRLPDVADLQVAALAGSIEAASAEILRRCVIEARHEGALVDPIDLPNPIVAWLGAQIEKADPLVENGLAVDCQACGHPWHALLDIGAFLLTEIVDAGRRLLMEVDQLARRYGWREDDILAMSSVRRRAYLNLEA